jgi:hypothetical protein
LIHFGHIELQSEDYLPLNSESAFFQRVTARVDIWIAWKMFKNGAFLGWVGFHPWGSEDLDSARQLIQSNPTNFECYPRTARAARCLVYL